MLKHRLECGSYNGFDYHHYYRDHAEFHTTTRVHELGGGSPLSEVVEATQYVHDKSLLDALYAHSQRAKKLTMRLANRYTPVSFKHSFRQKVKTL
jgi:hypothetical protein